MIGEVLSANRYLQELDLALNPLGNSGAALVLEGAKEAKCLDMLNLNRIDADCALMPSLEATIQERARTAADDFQSGQSLTVPLVVTLHGNNITDMALMRLCGQMPRSSADQIECDMHIVQSGEIHQRDLSESFINYIEEGGKGDLKFTHFEMNAEGVAHQITVQLENDRCPVEALDLEFHSLDDESTSLLAESLRSNSTLRGLRLESNCIENRGFVALSKVLVESNRFLQWLELRNNPLFDGSSGVSATESWRHHLGKLLTQAVSLKYLGLAYTGVGDEECRVIASALATNTGGITFIDLGANKISDSGAAILSGGLEQNTTVQLLGVYDNEIGEDGAVAISRCVQIREWKQCRLHRVWMGGNKVNDDQLTGCMVNAAFKYLNISDAIAKYLE